MKRVGKALLLIILMVTSFFIVNSTAKAEVEYKSELVDYSETFGIKEYTYELSIIITGTSKVNHIEGKLHLTNLELRSFTMNNNFVSSFNSSTLEYNMTSNHVYTASEGKIVYANVVVKNIDTHLECKFEYEPYKQRLVPTNTFTIEKNAYKNGNVVTSVKAGEEFQYRISVKSANNYIATDNVYVSDVIPNELEILSVSNSGSISGQRVSWNLGSFSPGEREIILTVNVRAKKDSKGKVKNTAILTVGDNSFQDEELTDILYSEITIDKKVSRSSVIKGEEFYYTLTIKNIGTGLSDNVVVEDTLDDDLELISTSISNTKNGNKLIFNLGTIKANETKVIRINVKAKNTINKEIIPNTAIATEQGKPPVQDSEDVKIVEEVVLPSITINKKASVEEIKKGEEFFYTIIVKNNNELNLIDLSIIDTLDRNLEYVSSSIEPVVQNGAYIWTFDLNGNETKEITITVRIKEDADTDKVLNTAILSFEDKDTPSEEVEVKIIPEEIIVAPPDEIENPNTGNVISLILINGGIVSLLGIGYYIHKNRKFYRI